MYSINKSHFTQISVHPIFYGTFAFILGIWIQSTLSNVADTCFFILLIISVTLALWTITKSLSISSIKLIALVLSFFLFGFGRSYYQRKIYENFISTYQNESVEIIGQIVDKKETHISRYQKNYTIFVNKILGPSQTNWTKSGMNLQIYTSDAINLEIDDSVHIKNIYIKKNKNTSFALYLIKESIAATLFCQKLNVAILNRPNFSIHRLFHAKRKSLIEQLKTAMDKKTFAYFCSLFLGNRTIEKKHIDTIQEKFKRWGITHYLARSGLHLVIFVIIWQKLLTFISISFIFKELIMLILASVYFLLSWSSISFIRAFAIFILYKICIFTKSSAHFLHIVTLVCLITLIINPAQFFFLDFQLSFLLTFCLGWFNQLSLLQRHTNTHQEQVKNN